MHFPWYLFLTENVYQDFYKPYLPREDLLSHSHECGQRWMAAHRTHFTKILCFSSLSLKIVGWIPYRYGTNIFPNVWAVLNKTLHTYGNNLNQLTLMTLVYHWIKKKIKTSTFFHLTVCFLCGPYGRKHWEWEGYTNAGNTSYSDG